MKKLFYFLATTLIALILGSCHKDGPVSPYTLKDLEGTWMWTIIDGEYNTNMWIDWITAEGIDTCRYIKDGKWQEDVHTLSLKNGVLSNGAGDDFLVINVDNYTMVVENITTKVRMTAEKAHEKDRKFLAGTWHADTYVMENVTLTNYEITYNEDGTYVAKYDGSEPDKGTFSLLNDFLFYQSDYAGIIRMSVDMTETGPQTTEVILTSKGEAIVNNCQRIKGGPQITLEDINKTWITTTKDGEAIPLDDAAICKVIDDNGHSIIGYVKDGKWQEFDVTLTVDNNIVTRVIGTTTEKFYVMYFDRETIIWRNISTGSVVTRKAIREPDVNKEGILGFWKDDTDGSRAIFTADSVFYKEEDYEVRAKYKLYGGVTVAYTEEACEIFFLEFGYDKERGERFVKWIDMEEDLPATFVFYQPNLETKLAGGWIWDKENDIRVPLSHMELSFYNPMTKMHDYQTFADGGEHILEPYYIEGRTIYYPEDTDDLPNEVIMSIDDSIMVTKGSDGITYRASRIFMDNPLNEKIVGTWDCSNFVDVDTNNFTHTFDKNGLVTCVINGTTTLYGTYRLYNSLLIMQYSNAIDNNAILWVIKDKKIENGTMTFSRLLEDGTTIENILTKR